jgi:hypothetical protein
LLVMAPSSQELEPPANPGRFSPVRRRFGLLTGSDFLLIYLTASHEHTSAGIAPINQTFSEPGTPSRRAVNSTRMVANIIVTVLTKRLSIRGFIVNDFAPHRPDFLRDVSA